MKFFKEAACAAAVAFAMVGGNANASAVMNNWVFNPNGGGFTGGQVISEYLDVNGNAFIELTATGASSFNFVEHAAFNLSQADSNGQAFPLNYPGGNITATFEAFGTGNFSGAFSFGGGTFRMYQNPSNGQYSTTTGIYGANLGTLIAEFAVVAGGGGLVDGSGLPTTDGQVSVLAKVVANGPKPGYFFSADGTDLSGVDVLSFELVNTHSLGLPNGNVVGEIACQFAGYSGPGCGSGTYSNVSGNHFLVSSKGQFKLAGMPNEVSEPSSLALVGLAMLVGAGAIGRKRKQA